MQLKSCLLCLALLWSPLVLTTACKTPQERIVYNTVSSVAISVNTAIDVYLKLAVNGRVSTNNLARIMSQYGEFQKVLRIAKLAVDGKTNTIAPGILVDAGFKLTAAIEAEKKGAQ